MNKITMTDSDKIRLARFAGWVTALFSLVMTFLLIANFVQTRVNDPINNKTIPALVKRLSQNPADETLKAEIRAFDLMARKAYFTSHWQLRTGSYLLILGVLLTVLSVRYIQSTVSKLSEMDRIRESGGLDDLLARKWVLYSGSGLLLMALAAGYLSNNVLKDYQVNENGAINEENISSVQDPGKPGASTIGNTAAVNSATGTASRGVAKSGSTETGAAEIGNVVNPGVVPGSGLEKKSKDSQSSSVKSTDNKAGTTPPNTAQTDAANPNTSKSNAAPGFPTLAELKSNYPNFRGSEGIGVSFQKNTPVDWNGGSGKNILWKVKVPKSGFSTPIIWGNQLFVTGADAQARMVYCYDKNTGKLLWEGAADKIAGSPTSMPKVSTDTGLAAPTMATDGKAVFAIFATGDVIAFDLDGKRLWGRNLGVPDNHYGHSSSLIVYKDKLLVQYDTNRSGKLLALSTTTGETVWETVRKSKIAWSSPALVNTGKRMEAILSCNPNVSSYDPETGKELWSIDCLSGEVGPSVGYADGMVFAANEYAKLVGIKLGETPAVAWEADEFLPEASSPLAIKDLLYIATSYGVFACYEAKTGKKLWSQEYGDPFYASPVYADGKVYITDMAGKTHIVKATREYELIGTPELGEKSVCSPVFVGGKAYIRGMNQLYCIGMK
jgi:outer membrane protein assembly factor BamB